LTRRAWTSVQPNYSGIVLDSVFDSDILFAIEDKSESGTCLIDVEIATPYKSTVVIRGNGKIDVTA
jgi:hypothetical protein